MMKKLTVSMFVVLPTLFVMADIHTSAIIHHSAEDTIHQTPGNVITEYFNRLTFEPGSWPDWEKVKALFINEAVIVYRLGPKKIRAFTRQDFIDYLDMDFKRANLKASGFTMNVISRHQQIIKEITHCYTLYEVSIPGMNDNQPVNRGINSFHLIKQEGRWLIASIINEGFSMEEKIPSFINK